MSILDQMEEIAKKMQNGTATIEEAEKFRYMSCQQIIISLGIKGTAELVKLERSKLNAAVDSIALLMFPGEWKFEPKLVEIDVKTEHT